MLRKKVKELVLIDRMAKVFKTADPLVVVSIGDDVAVVQGDQGKYLLYTCDMLVESVHFKKNENFEKIGYKAMAVSVSDIAAKGGIPRYALVSVGLPPKRVDRFIRGLMMGMKRCAKKFGFSIIGGDTNRSRHLVVDVFMAGEVEKKNLVLRSTAQVGDLIFVSGSLGGSLKHKHLDFTPRLPEARFLVKNFKINSMMDLSDGLGMDLNRLVRSSRVGALIFENKIPQSSDSLGINSALYDGEDFELLFTLKSREAFKLLSQIKNSKEFKFICIGRITDLFDGVRMIKNDCRMLEIPWRGFRHF
jgi:thiamine-monophosphate kinase